MDDEDKIKMFFEDLKLADKRVRVPDFKEIQKPKNRHYGSLLRLGFAASLIILFGVFTLKISQKEVMDSGVLNRLPLSTEIESITTNSLIKAPDTVEEWIAPSNSLINNYHEW